MRIAVDPIRPVDISRLLTHPARWMLKRAVGGILTEAVLPESTNSTRCHRRLAVSKETVVTLREWQISQQHVAN